MMSQRMFGYKVTQHPLSSLGAELGLFRISLKSLGTAVCNQQLRGHAQPTGKDDILLLSLVEQLVTGPLWYATQTSSIKDSRLQELEALQASFISYLLRVTYVAEDCFPQEQDTSCIQWVMHVSGHPGCLGPRWNITKGHSNLELFAQSVELALGLLCSFLSFFCSYRSQGYSLINILPVNSISESAFLENCTGDISF